MVHSSPYTSNTILTLVVGNGISCPANISSCSSAAPLYLVELNTTGLVTKTPIDTGLTISSTDYYIGSLHRCADGTCVTFTGIDTVSGTNPGSTIPYFPNADRVIGKIDSNSNIDLSTRIKDTIYTGIPKAVCSIDGSQYWVVGNTTNQRLCPSIMVKVPILR